MKDLIDSLRVKLKEMLADKRRRIIALVAVVFVVGLAAALPGYMKKTSTTEYCASCHVMLPQYEDWFYGGKHTQIRCVDCHLPNDNFVNHYIWKGLDGIKDVLYFYTGLVPDPIHSSRHARKTIQKNCIRCHEGLVSAISVDTMNCWDCHRNQFHNRINEF